MSPTQPSFDTHQVREVAILVTSSPHSACSSIGTGSPTLLIPESSLHDARRSSSSSSHGTPTVKFAPLPPIDPNRKRSLAPLGVPGRSRRTRVIQQDGGSVLWSPDPDMPDEDAEDPVITFAKFIKKTGMTLWRRVRKNSEAAIPQDKMASAASPVLDINISARPDDLAIGDQGSVGVGSEDKRGQRASWSSLRLAECGALSRDKARMSTSDLRLSIP